MQRFWSSLCRPHLQLVGLILASTLAVGPSMAQYDPPALSSATQESLLRQVKAFDQAINAGSPNAILYVERGNAYFQLKQTENAIQDFTKAIQLKPERAEGYCLRAMCYASTGRFAEALADMNEDIKRRPDHLNSYLIRASVYESLGQLDQAKADLEHILKLSSNFPKAEASLARVLVKQGKKLPLPGGLTETIKVHSTNSTYLIEVGLSLYEHGRLDDAIKALDAAVRANPSSSVAYMNRGSVHDDLGQSEIALQDYDKAISLDSKSAPAYFNRGVCHGRRKEYQEALFDFNQDLRMRPQHQRGYQARALVYRILGAQERAAADQKMADSLPSDGRPNAFLGGFPQPPKIFKPNSTNKTSGISFKISPEKTLGDPEKKDYQQWIDEANKQLAQNKDNIPMLMLRAGAYHNLHNSSAAVQDLSRILVLQPNHPQALLMRGTEHVNQEKAQEAITDLDKYIAIDPNNTLAYLSRGVAHGLLGQSEKALQDFNKCLKLDPANIQALYSRAFEYGKAARFNDALADVDKLLSIDPKNVEALRLRGKLNLSKNDAKSAITDFNQAIAANPTDTASRELRVTALTATNNKDDALKEIDELLKLKPDASGAFRERAILSTESNPNTALKDLNTCLSLNPKDAAALHSRARIYSDLKQIDQAKADFQQLLKLNLSPENREKALLNYAVILGENKDFSEAEAQINEAKKSNPKSIRACHVSTLIKMEQKNYPGALLEANKAIELDTKNPNSYISRADINLHLRDFAQAKQDTNEALKLAPKDIKMWAFMCLVDRCMGDSNTALADINKALELQPSESYLYVERAAVYQLTKQYELAIADCNHALRLKRNNTNAVAAKTKTEYLLSKDMTSRENIEEAAKKSPDSILIRSICLKAAEKLQKNDLIMRELQAIAVLPAGNDELYTRGIARFRLQEFSGAAKDFASYANSDSVDSERKLFSSMLGYFCLTKCGNDQEANTLLDQVSKKASVTGWPRPIAKYLQKQLSEEELIEAANNDNKKTEAFTYIALSKQLEGKTAESGKMLEWVTKSGNPEYSEYSICQSMTNSSLKPPKTSELHNAMKTAAIDPNWTQIYLLDLERRIQKNWAGSAEEELTAHFKIHSGGEPSDIIVASKSGEITNTNRSRIKNTILQGAPYKPFDQVNQLDVNISFKGNTLHAALE